MSLKTIYFILVGLFVLILGQFFLPPIRNLFKVPFFSLFSWFVFSLSGFLLIRATYKQQIKGRLKLSLCLAGASAVAFFISILLHNFLSVLPGFLSFLSGLFFIIAVVISPLVCLVGIIGSAVFFKNNNYHA